MKKYFLIAFLIAMLSCNSKSPEQMAKESFEKREQEQLAEERKADSLIRVAMGEGIYEYQKKNRLNALEELKKYYLPQMRNLLISMRKWKKIFTILSKIKICNWKCFFM